MAVPTQPSAKGANMENLGEPFSIQNTTGPYWYVTWDDAVRTNTGEAVSFTVRIPRSAHLTVEEVQRHAQKRAVELLQIAMRASSGQ
jgi:hypothetical protein